MIGEAGVGKSRLIREFLARAQRHGPLAVLHARCPAGGSGSAYWPLAEVLRESSGASLALDARTAAASLETHLAELFPAGGAELDEVTQALAVTASLTLPDNPLDQADPGAIDYALLKAWPRYLGARAARGGVILVVEDIHWADPQLLRVVRSVHRAAVGGLAMILSTRNEIADDRPDFVATEEGWTLLRLPSLQREDGERLVRELVHAPQLAASLAAGVAKRAEGNPLYIEETIRLLIDSGALRVRGGTTEVVDTAQLVASPDSIAGLLAARIEGLAGDERRAVHAAAIVGRRFWDGAAAQALHRRSVRGDLVALEQRGLVHRRATSLLAGQTEYVFKHALIRDAAYDGMPRGRRARAHAAVGRWLESVAGDRVEAVHEFVAEHYRRGLEEGDAAGIWETHPDEREELRALAHHHLLAVGDAARRGYAIDRAIAFHRHALDTAATPSDRARALGEIGEGTQQAVAERCCRSYALWVSSDGVAE